MITFLKTKRKKKKMGNGKGDKNRPKNISYNDWSKKYEEIFRKKKEDKKNENKS